MSRRSLPSSIRSPFIVTRRLRGTAGGWHTAALTMRLMVEGYLKPAGHIMAPASTNRVVRIQWGRATNYV